MPSEYAPPPPKIRVTRKQVQEMQESYRKALEKAEDHSKEELAEKSAEIRRLEKELEENL